VGPPIGKALTTFQGHESTIRALAFAPDGRRLASGGTDRMIRVWNLTNKAIFSPLRGHEGTVRALAFSADGTLARRQRRRHD